MSKRAMEELKEMLCMEVDEIAKKGQIAAGDLQTLHMLTDTIKNIDKIGMLDEGYSGADDWPVHAEYSRGYGYARGGGYSGRRNAMGRYSRDDGNDMITERISEMVQSGRYSGAEKETLDRAMRIMAGR